MTDNKQFNAKNDYIKSISESCNKLKPTNGICCENVSYKNKTTQQPFNTLSETLYTNKAKNELRKYPKDDNNNMCLPKSLPQSSYVKPDKIQQIKTANRFVDNNTNHAYNKTKKRTKMDYLNEIKFNNVKH